MRTHLDVIRDLARWDPPVILMGGYAEDAILHGRETREHADIDVFVLRRDLNLRIEQARAIGFDDFHVRFEPREGRPLVVGAIVDDLNLEYCVFDQTNEGRLYFDTPTGSGLTRVWLPEDTLARNRSAIDGIEIQTVSPLALYQIRIGVTNTFGGLRPKDHVSQAALRRRFFEGVPEEELVPLIEPAPRLSSSGTARYAGVPRPGDACGPPLPRARSGR